MKPAKCTTVFLDLDGVLADFVGGALATHGHSLPRREVRWGFMEQIGFKESDPAFWEPFNREFWANLPPTKECHDLLAAVECIAGRDRISILSSPCMTPGCLDGKRDWIARHLPPGYLKRTFLGGAKHLLAHPKAILIDDYELNTSAFTTHGGTSILVPRPWNWMRTHCDDEGNFDVPVLKQYLSYAWNGVLPRVSLPTS